VQEPQQVVSTIPGLFGSSGLADKAEGSYDVLVCGGTLGIFVATALCTRGLRVAIVERNALKGVISAPLIELSTFNPTMKRVSEFFEGLID